MPRRWYQTIEVEGSNAVFEDINRKDSKFWNEGKWNNFIKPLLPEERRTFLELGCNAGLFLKMATDDGFEDVIGVDSSRSIMERQAKCFKDSNKYTYKLVTQQIGRDFELDQLPLSDVVLMSNVHYYLPIPVFSNLVDELKSRSLYCIVVSARAKRRSGNALWDINSVRGYFRDWQEVKVIDGLDIDDDVCPREQMYSVLFKGNLSVIDVDDMYDAWWEAAKSKRHRSHHLAPAMADFFSKVLSGESFEYEDTLYYQYWMERRPNKSLEWLRNLLMYKESIAIDIQDNGIKTPIYYIENGHLRDGIHRLCIAKLLGYKHILGRLI